MQALSRLKRTQQYSFGPRNKTFTIGSEVDATVYVRLLDSETRHLPLDQGQAQCYGEIQISIFG